MATPFGHSLAGWAAYRFIGIEAEDHDHRVAFVLLSLAMANAPDLDFLPGLLAGRPALFHQGISHSIGMALVVSLGVAGLCRLRNASFGRVFSLCLVSWLSHLFLDFFGPDGRLPNGIPVLWPVSQETFMSPVPVLLGVQHAPATSASTVVWITGILDLDNLKAVGLEVVLVGPFVLTAKHMNRALVHRVAGWRKKIE